jgi:hypothetical protein
MDPILADDLLAIGLPTKVSRVQILCVYAIQGA